MLHTQGLGLLALGAGVGEETLFRAVGQARLVDDLAGVAQPWGTALGITATSVVFGLLHALTPTYFVLATVAGVLFGLEYLTAGLPAAAFTHFAYDWVALVFIIRELGGGSSSSGGGGAGSSSDPSASG